MMMMPNNMLAQRLGIGGQMQPQAYPQPWGGQPMVNTYAGPMQGGQMPMQSQPMQPQMPMQPPPQPVPQQPMQGMPQNNIRARLGL